MYYTFSTKTVFINQKLIKKACIKGGYMSFRVYLEIFKALIAIILLFVLIINGRLLISSTRKGYKYIIIGFALIAFASVLDITDNFEVLNKFVIIGDTPYQAILEKIIGYICGSLFLAIGFWLWLPKVNELHNTHQKLKQSLDFEISLKHAIENEKTRLAVTLKSIGDGVISTDINTKIIMLNPVASQMTGWSEEEAIGKSIEKVFTIVKEGTDLPVESPINKVLETGEIVELANHTELISKDGNRINIADSGAPVRSTDGDIMGVVLVFRDVTSEKENFNEKLKSQKLESIGILAGGIAHDFNNLLMGIQGNLSLILNFYEIEDEIKELILDAGKASKRAAQLTKQLLTFSKGGEPNIQDVAIEKIIKETTGFILTGSNVKYQFEIDKNLCYAKVDKGQISQVIENLIINARQSMPKGGTITITLKNVSSEEVKQNKLTQKQYISITIKDTGYGIDAENLNKIFDPYFSTKSTGSGLGLATVFSIISKHNGKIKVTSKKGKGSAFTIYLPAGQKNVDNSLGNEKNANQSSPLKGKVLVMDDEAFIRKLLSVMLDKLGYEVLTAENGEEAIKIYKKFTIESGNQIKFVMLDLTIPGGMGGQETAKKLLEINKDVKMIVMSGYTDDPVVAMYKEYGFYAALSKPFDLEHFNNLLMKNFSS